MPTVSVLTKTGRIDREFEEQAVRRTRVLIAKHFGTELPVSASLLREWKIGMMLWMEGEDGETVATTLVSTNKRGDFLRLNGLAVETEHQRKGYGTAILNHLDTLIPKGTMVEVTVQLDTENTKWLVDWYSRRGFKEAGIVGVEIRMLKRY